MKNQSNSIVALTNLIALAFVIFVAATGLAGDLEPSAAPGPTMKTLDQIPPTWSIKLPAAERFVVLADFNNEAVLDKETGLVWEKSPLEFEYEWESALSVCYSSITGGRGGWRLPTIEELASIVDPLAASDPALPSGHPFSNVHGSHYWSATTIAYADGSYAWNVTFDHGWDPKTFPSPKSTNYHFWCVRGSHGYDAR